MSRSALDFVHGLLLRPSADHPTLGGLLQELAGAFAAPAAGLVGLPDGRSICFPEGHRASSWPWQDDPSLLDRAREAPGAAIVERPSGSLLVTTLTAGDGSAWVLWVESHPGRSWGEAEAGALALAGHVLGRWVVGEGRPRWAEQLDRAARQERLETAASVTRRLAHDFGNVLTGILGFTELALAQQVPSNTPLHTYLNEVYRSAQTGAQFTHQLRLFSRRQSATSRWCQLSAVLAEQEARLFSARDSGLNLRLDVPADLPPVALDSEHLHGVLTALLDNAREALVGPGSISVSARLTEVSESECQDVYGAVRSGPHVEIIIADTGIGLSPDVQRRLFAEPFFTTKPRRRGFGLVVAYGILHAHRGGLRLHPGAEHGVVARVLLPVAPTPLPVPPVEEAVRPSERIRADRVLVVDDEPEVLGFVTATLERAGFRVDGAAGGEAALDTYFGQMGKGEPFRLVLTDVVMPGMNGVELVRRLLKGDPSARVLFMSARVSNDFTQQDFAGHAFEMLPKPFRADSLVKAVRSALDRGGRRGPADVALTKK
jgi:signal transduction histidine kinase/CheY-like chemotaxis protein